MMIEFIPAKKIQKSKVKRIQKANATGLEPAAAVATLVCYSWLYRQASKSSIGQTPSASTTYIYYISTYQIWWLDRKMMQTVGLLDPFGMSTYVNHPMRTSCRSKNLQRHLPGRCPPQFWPSKHSNRHRPISTSIRSGNKIRLWKRKKTSYNIVKVKMGILHDIARAFVRKFCVGSMP